MNKWNGKRFSIYDNEEKQVLGLLKKVGDQVNYNTDEVERLTISDNKKVSHEEMYTKYKVDENANFTGSWHGIEKPTQVAESMATMVTSLTEKDIPQMKMDIERKTEKTDFQELQTRVNELTKLPEGSSLADAELNDGRITVFGAKFSNIGSAIREQIKLLVNDGIPNATILDFSSPKNGYVSSGGEFVGNSAYYITITLNANETVKFYASGYEQNVAMIAKKVNVTYTPLVSCTDSNKKWYEYTAPSKMTILLSFVDKTNVGGLIYKKVNTALKEKVDNSIIGVTENYASFISDCYINVSGQKILGSSSSHVMTDPITVSKGDIIFVTCSTVKNIVSVISKVVDGKYTPLYKADSDAEKTYKYEFMEDMQIVISAHQGWNKSYILYNKFNANQLPTIEEDLTPCFSMFEKFGVIGDSYASGEVVLTGYNDYYNVSWGQILSRMTGTKCINFSSGGLSTRSWLSSTKGLQLLNSSEVQQLYILALGINDWYALGSSYLGTKSDIESKVDTFYGNYARIIESVKTKAPKSKIVIFTIVGTTEIVNNFNNAIKELATYYNIPCIDQNTDPLYTNEYYTGKMLQGHPVAAVYSAMAKANKRLIEKCMKEKHEYFKDFIG